MCVDGCVRVVMVGFVFVFTMLWIAPMQFSIWLDRHSDSDVVEFIATSLNDYAARVTVLCYVVHHYLHASISTQNTAGVNVCSHANSCRSACGSASILAEADCPITHSRAYLPWTETN